MIFACAVASGTLRPYHDSLTLLHGVVVVTHELYGTVCTICVSIWRAKSRRSRATYVKAPSNGIDARLRDSPKCYQNERYGRKQDDD